MNKIISIVGSLIVIITALLFSVFMLIDFNFQSYFVCMLLAIGYIMMSSGFFNEINEKSIQSFIVGMVFASIYAILVFIVYFAQITSVRLDSLDDKAMAILDYSKIGLFFNYDLLGYSMMSLSTFFIGLAIDADKKMDKCLKYMMMLHGLFFFSCFIMPMTGILNNSMSKNVGVIALEFWCVYFISISILSLIHFIKSN